MSLRIPGPTPVPNDILQVMSKQMINHRGKEFGKLLQKVTTGLKQAFQTEGDVLILTCSGTGAMESSIVNTLSPGDKVLSLSNGVFGDRYASIAERYGADVTRVKFEWGKAVDPAGVKQALEANRAAKAVLVTHNETSTGVVNDLAAIGALVREADKLLLVDAISSLGCVDLQVDNWGCDVVVTGSQKGWMVPPGLAFVSVSKRAWEAQSTARMPRFYFDFKEAKSYLEKDQTPWTPAISIFYALDLALDAMAKEGLQNIFARHARLGKRTRDGVHSLGLSLFAEDGSASNTVTAVKSPDGVDGKKLVETVREEHGVVLAGGQGSLAGKIFRIGHLGFVTEADIDHTIAQLRLALPKVGFKVPGGVS